MTINKMSEIKKKIDEACEEVVLEVEKSLSEDYVQAKVHICYHGHYSKIAFSIFTSGLSEEPSKTFEHDEADFFVSETISLEDMETRITMIKDLLATKEF